MDEAYASLVLLFAQELSGLKGKIMVDYFGSCLAAYDAGVAGWKDVAATEVGNNDRFPHLFDEAREKADREMGKVEEMKATVIPLTASTYPPLLRQISDPPLLLFTMGREQTFDDPALAIVGSRRCTYYGEQMVKYLVQGIVGRGFVTVSGLARGIDRLVHEGTIREKGSTWAVLGCGLDCIYPPEHVRLAHEVSQNGVLISEFPFGTPPLPHHFPQRNRIIAGLSLGTIVVEGTEKSGSLITARLAAEEGREVFAVPGPVTSPYSRAPHILIKAGAKLVENADDVLSEFKFLASPSRAAGTPDLERSHGLEGKAEKIISFLESVPVSRDRIAEKFGESPEKLAPMLLELELNGFIQILPGGMLVKRN